MPMRRPPGSKRQFNDNAARLLDKVEDFKTEIADLERQLNNSFEKLNTAMRIWTRPEIL